MEPKKQVSPQIPAELEFRWWGNEWDIGGRDESRSERGTIPVQIGPTRPFEGFPGLAIRAIAPDRIRLEDRFSSEEVTPTKSASFHCEIDGHEDHDGVLWNGEVYHLEISWPR